MNSFQATLFFVSILILACNPKGPTIGQKKLQTAIPQDEITSIFNKDTVATTIDTSLSLPSFLFELPHVEYLRNIDKDLPSNFHNDLRDKKHSSLGKKLSANWILRDGFFPEEDLLFEKSATSDTSAVRVFIFHDDFRIKYRIQDFGDCPVGTFTMKQGKWEEKNGFLTLEMRGLKISDYWYWYKVRYKIEAIDNETLSLSVDQILKNIKISPTGSWKELISK